MRALNPPAVPQVPRGPSLSVNHGTQTHKVYTIYCNTLHMGHGLMAWSSPKWCMSEKKDRFFSDSGRVHGATSEASAPSARTCLAGRDPTSWIPVRLYVRHQYPLGAFKLVR